MLDLQFICDNREAVEANCRNRGIDVDLERLISLSNYRRKLIVEGDNLRHEQKEVSGRIPRADGEERPPLIARGKQLKEEISDNERRLRSVESDGDLRGDFLRSVAGRAAGAGAHAVCGGQAPGRRIHNLHNA